MAEKFPENNNDSEESKKIVKNFKNELEKLKQKLSKDFYKCSKIEKEKDGGINFHYMNNSKIEPNIKENNFIELKQDIKIATDNIDNIINITETKDEKTSTKSKTNSNNSIFTKIPSFDELKSKYGINLNNKPNSIKEITIETNMNKFKKDKNINKIIITEKNDVNNELIKENKIIHNTEIINKSNNNLGENIALNNKQNNDKKDINDKEENNKDIDNIDILKSNKKINENTNIIDETTNDKVNKINKINTNKINENNNNIKKDDNKYDYMNLLDLKKNTEEEIKKIFNRREILDLSDNSENKENSENSNEEIIINNKVDKKIINKEDDDEELEIINNYINDEKSASKNNNNLSILKNMINTNNININNNNNISYFSNISNINNNQETQKQLIIDEPGSTPGKFDKNNLKQINNLTKENNPENNIITSPNITNNDTKNNNLILENDNKSRMITYESPSKMGMNNNNSIVDTSMLNSKIDQQIKLINEKSENNRIEEEKNLLKLKEIENSLQLDKRLTHTNREIRKNAIKELCEMCTNFNCDEDDKAKAFECFSPWVKYCLEETNSYVIPESLNFFILFNSLFPNFLNSSMKDFFDNIERYINFGISSINENCFKIFFLFFQDKKLFGQSMNEIIKLLNSSYIKMIKFLNSLLISMIENNIIYENYVKILFEKMINIYVKMGKKVGEKRNIYSKLLIYIYNNIEDDYNTCIKNNIKLSSYKEIDSLFNKIKKNKKKYKYRLYPKNECSNIDNESQVIDKNNYPEKTKVNKIPEKIIKENNKDNLNNLILNNNNPDANDIISILPNEFFEYHFLTQFQPKIKLLEDTNNILNKIKNVRDKEKNLVDVYKTINYSIEDSNILIHLEGIKLLENICRLVKNFINMQKLKLLLETCFDKLKDKKSLVKNELFILFNMIIENHCFEIDKFILFILQFCTNQKKENAQVKMGLLEYIKILFSQQNNILFYEIQKIKEKDYFSFIKKIVSIIQKESLFINYF